MPLFSINLRAWVLIVVPKTSSTSNAVLPNNTCLPLDTADMFTKPSSCAPYSNRDVKVVVQLGFERAPPKHPSAGAMGELFVVFRESGDACASSNYGKIWRLRSFWNKHHSLNLPRSYTSFVLPSLPPRRRCPRCWHRDPRTIP